MTIRIINPTVHGILDYLAAAGLVVLPFLLDLGRVEPLAPWISVAGGVVLTAYSVLTDYRFAVLRVLPIGDHLKTDLLAAAVFLAVPFLFSFEGLVAGYFWFMGFGVVAVVALSHSESHEPEQPSTRLEM